MKKTFARKIMMVLLVCAILMTTACSALAAPSRGNLIHFIPTSITVKSDSVTVYGYFVNLNDDCDVKNFTNFDMTVYKDGDELVDGSFGTINEFTVKSMGTKYQSFTFNGSHDLNVGEYDCNDYYYCVFSCDFSYVNK